MTDSSGTLQILRHQCPEEQSLKILHPSRKVVNFSFEERRPCRQRSLGCDFLKMLPYVFPPGFDVLFPGFIFLELGKAFFKELRVGVREDLADVQSEAPHCLVPVGMGIPFEAGEYYREYHFAVLLDEVLNVVIVP